MYPHDEKQLEFFLPFGGKLFPNNRWIKLAGLIPWAEFENSYSKSFKGDGDGPPAKSFRVALGALNIKERLDTHRLLDMLAYALRFLGFQGKDALEKGMAGPEVMVPLKKKRALAG